MPHIKDISNIVVCWNCLLNFGIDLPNICRRSWTGTTASAKDNQKLKTEKLEVRVGQCQILRLSMVLKLIFDTNVLINLFWIIFFLFLLGIFWWYLHQYISYPHILYFMHVNILIFIYIFTWDLYTGSTTKSCEALQKWQNTFKTKQPLLRSASTS